MGRFRQSIEQICLSAEIAVKRTCGNAGLTDNPAQRSRLKAFIEEFIFARVQDSLSGSQTRAFQLSASITTSHSTVIVSQF